MILSIIGISVLIILLICIIAARNDYWSGTIYARVVYSEGISAKMQPSETLTYYPYGHKDRNLKVASDLTEELVDITDTCAARITTETDMFAVCDRFFQSYTLHVMSFFIKNEAMINQIVSPLSLLIPLEDLTVNNGSSDLSTLSIHRYRGEDMSRQLVTIWSACTDEGLSTCNDIAGEFVTSISALLLNGAEDIKDIMTEEEGLPRSMPRGVALQF